MMSRSLTGINRSERMDLMTPRPRAGWQCECLKGRIRPGLPTPGLNPDRQSSIDPAEPTPMGPGKRLVRRKEIRSFQEYGERALRRNSRPLKAMRLAVEPRRGWAHGLAIRHAHLTQPCLIHHVLGTCSSGTRRARPTQTQPCLIHHVLDTPATQTVRARLGAGAGAEIETFAQALPRRPFCRGVPGDAPNRSFPVSSALGSRACSRMVGRSLGCLVVPVACKVVGAPGPSSPRRWRSPRRPPCWLVDYARELDPAIVRTSRCSPPGDRARDLRAR